MARPLAHSRVSRPCSSRLPTPEARSCSRKGNGCPTSHTQGKRDTPSVPRTAKLETTYLPVGLGSARSRNCAPWRSHTSPIRLKKTTARGQGWDVSDRLRTNRVGKCQRRTDRDGSRLRGRSAPSSGGRGGSHRWAELERMGRVVCDKRKRATESSGLRTNRFYLAVAVAVISTENWG
jgi:hypothetical protein